jgi:hypothetical protein
MPFARHAAIVVGVLLLSEGLVRADPTADAAGLLLLQWVAPAECPTREDVVRDVVRLLGPTPTSAEPLTARAHLSRSADGRWHGRIETPGPSGGTRTLDAPSCKALADATALVLALRINPRILTNPPPEAPTPPPTAAPRPPEPPPAPPPPPIAPPTKDDARREPHAPAASWSVAALALGTANELPSPEVSGELVVGYAPPRFGGRLRVELHGEAGASQQTSTQVVGPGQMLENVPGSALAAGGGLRGCYGPSWRALAVLGCAGVELDWMQVEGKGPTPSTQSAVWATVEVGGQVRWTLARWLALRLDLTGLVSTAPPEFVVRSSDGAILGVVSQPGHVWGRLGVGAEALLF